MDSKAKRDYSGKGKVEQTNKISFWFEELTFNTTND